MMFRAMDAGCGGVDGDDADAECPGPVTAAGLYLTSVQTVWRSFACDQHAHQLIAPRELRTRDLDTIRQREELAQDPRIGRRYAGEQDGPIARGAAAAKLVHDAIEWGKRNPFGDVPPPDRTNAQPDRQRTRMTVEALADELAVDPGDVRVLLSWIDPERGGLYPDGTLLNAYGAAIRDQLDQMCVRSVPDYWWPGHDPAAGTGATKMR